MATRTRTNPFIETITSDTPEIRNRSLAELCEGRSTQELLDIAEELEAFRREARNLYERVRATLFLFALYRFHLMEAEEIPDTGTIHFESYEKLLSRRFEEAIAEFREVLHRDGPNGTVLSALAEGYHHLTFQTLTDQVRRSVRASLGNRWMFRVGHAADHAVRIRREMLERKPGTLLFPILCERTSVRLDLSHSGWSDIFFLGMDYPEGARVLNISVDLAVRGREETVRPPVESYVRVIDEPVVRLTSVDLEATKDVADLADLFNFGNDYLGLLKAGVIASGLLPPSFEGTHQPMERILAQIVRPGMGMELVTKVNDIPKGSRLAVSTNLLASIVAVLMRATGQIRNLEGGMDEAERRLVASRAILGEWLGGSGGGWQDSGGIWPGIKIIEGAEAGEGDPEHGISRGCLLPRHRVLGEQDLHPDIGERLAQSLVLIHGGMAQNVGPILEMVTEKYLLRAREEWQARHAMRGIFDGIVDALAQGDLRQLGHNTTQNWNGPLKTIIPWVTNRFTESLIEACREEFGEDFWGFLMLGGMSGGGMALFTAPERRAEFVAFVERTMVEKKRELEDALPFAMDPVVYDFHINRGGSQASILKGAAAMMPARYYALQVPELVKLKPEEVSELRRADIDHFTGSNSEPSETLPVLRTMVNHLFRVSSPAAENYQAQWDAEAVRIKRENGFDPVLHERLRDDLQRGRIGLSRNRLPVDTEIRDVEDRDVMLLESDVSDPERQLGEDAMQGGKVAVVSLAAGMGSRWTQGAGCVKAANPFVTLDGKHRSFMEIHIAKSRKKSREYGAAVPHVLTTSFLTHAPVEKHLRLNGNFGYQGPLHLSPGRSIAQRLIPMVRDLMFLWEEMPQETLDENKQKVRDAVRATLMNWARSQGEGSDYTDNVPIQRFNPPGHWYEIPNLLLNGVLARLIDENPALETLMVHNIDTLGADLDPAALGHHLATGHAMTFEVVARRIGDRGGGLARVNNRVRLLEGLAQPREADEFKLRFYNTMTTWVGIDALLTVFGLTRDDLRGPEGKLREAVRAMAGRVPTYVTIKDAKRRWGRGQEDVFPVAQFEKLWSDMTSIPEVNCGFLVVPRMRGQQLKDPAELDPWANDGSRDYVAGLCEFA